MFGRGYFGARYFGERYYGPRVSVFTLTGEIIVVAVLIDGVNESITGDIVVKAVLLGRVGPPGVSSEPEVLVEYESGEREVIADIDMETVT